MKVTINHSLDQGIEKLDDESTAKRDSWLIGDLGKKTGN